MSEPASTTQDSIEEALKDGAQKVSRSETGSDAPDREAAMPELYFATVKAIGTDILPATHVLEAALGNAGYHAVDVHLSSLFSRVEDARQYLVDDSDASEYTIRNGFMDAGDALRTMYDTAAMAKLGLKEMCDRRRAESAKARQEGRRGLAFIVRSLMHESEGSFLRAVLGPRLFVISMFSHEDRRREALMLDLGSRPGPVEVSKDQIEAWADDLMLRDQGREFKYVHPLEAKYSDVKRLSLEKTFHEADFFVDLDRQPLAQAQIKRFVELIFGYPYATTTEDETALAHAFTALRESASVARRVGASIVVEGSVVAVGRNDVPEPGGGQLRLSTFPEPSDVMSAEPEASNEERADVLRDVIRRLFRSEDWAELLSEKGITGLESFSNAAIEDIADRAPSLDASLQSRIFDLIEFNPTVHAEMSAITTAARQGFALEGGTLYTTTFPCHECTRHIIATGIKRVVYLEPYAKSRAEALFRRQVRMGEKEDEVDEEATDNRVLYEPFMGIAPRRQRDLFSWVTRESSARAIRDWSLNRTRQLRSSIDPVVPKRLRVRLDESLHEEHLLAVQEFMEQITGQPTL